MQYKSDLMIMRIFSIHMQWYMRIYYMQTYKYVYTYLLRFSIECSITNSFFVLFFHWQTFVWAMNC